MSFPLIERTRQAFLKRLARVDSMINKRKLLMMRKGLRYVWAITGLLVLATGKSTLAQEPDSLRKFHRPSIYYSDKTVKHGGSDWLYTGLEINYIALNAADLITTFYGMDKGAEEANPVARLIIKNRPAAVIFKGGVTAGVLLGLSYVKKQNKPAAYIALGALNLLYGFVVHNNIGVYLNLK
jgi:hypothetical protein